MSVSTIQGPYNFTTGRLYSGGNIARLETAAWENQWDSTAFATFIQWKSVGRSVTKGQHGTRLQKMVEKTSKRTGKREIVPVPFTVFNLAQTEVRDILGDSGVN